MHSVLADIVCDAIIPGWRAECFLESTSLTPCAKLCFHGRVAFTVIRQAWPRGYSIRGLLSKLPSRDGWYLRGTLSLSFRTGKPERRGTSMKRTAAAVALTVLGWA
jgi:hypothetical protein